MIINLVPISYQRPWVSLCGFLVVNEAEYYFWMCFGQLLPYDSEDEKLIPLVAQLSGTGVMAEKESVLSAIDPPVTVIISTHCVGSSPGGTLKNTHCGPMKDFRFECSRTFLRTNFSKSLA
jgi:hypothetical protein